MERKCKSCDGPRLQYQGFNLLTPTSWGEDAGVWFFCTFGCLVKWGINHLTGR